jgi:ribosomal-protein-alanine N-acetyltransferase
MRTAIFTRLRAMTADDIEQVMEIERESFPSMWPQTAYRRELQNKLARYIVLSELRPPDQSPGQPGGVWGTLRKIVGADPALPDERLLGFIGVWLMVGEAHVVTLAVRETCRRMGIGERLIIASIELAMEAEQEAVTLEVRKSNDVAQRLYEKYGFDRVGLRVRYYTDNNEDAVLMSTSALLSPSYRAHFFRLREEHRARYPDLWT